MEKQEKTYQNIVNSVPFFKHFSQDRLSKIMSSLNLITINKSETVMFQEDEGTDLYIVLQGKVRITFLNMEGEELVLATFNTGDFFGEMSFIDNQPRSATVVAEEKAILGVIKQAQLLKFIQEDPMIATDLLTILVERLRKANEMIESLAFLNVRKRLIRFLLNQADAEGSTVSNGTIRIKKLIHKELATRTGASREAISKALKKLSEEKLILEADGHFVLSANVMDEIDPF